MKYSFIIFQDGKEIFRDEGLSQIGGDYRNFVFSDSGSIIIRIEKIYSPSIFAEESVTVFGNIENKEQRSVDFTTIVYDNTETTDPEIHYVQPAQRLEIYYELMIIIIIIPAILFIAALLWIRKKPDIQQSKSTAV